MSITVTRDFESEHTTFKVVVPRSSMENYHELGMPLLQRPVHPVVDCLGRLLAIAQLENGAGRGS